ncbi:hypothetical protein SK3146_00759 [Paenibacillus konkukensis]|uniref:Uncharacterized protein n=1 Tax=Paenibacillus konkukensis TaxID=2020716 RepID=A0ABY4RHC4_9BACL|nr:hypothetical protein [Paenibacillus konkukensis]UQZ81603.1 hypothetical protein SK3146_00759 [Paenibacillus konkukensis]
MVMSFVEMRRVPSEWLQERLETIKQLKEDSLELYEVAKDKLTGEHYLHYAYIHKQIAAIGPESSGEESFHHLMPIDSDDVLGLVFGEQSFDYPEHWKKAFLRNGPDGDYVWFDPSYTEQESESEEIGASLQEQLLRFKQAPERSEEAVRKLLEELDRTLGRDDNG